MLSTKEFAEWSTKVVLFLHNTSRCDDEPYPELLTQRGGNGFPTVSYLDAEGNLLKQVGHVTPVEQLETAHGELMVWKELRRQVEAGADAGKQKELFLLELGMGNRPFAEMSERRGKVALDDAEAATVAQQLVNLEFTEILRATPRKQPELGGKAFLAMFRSGCVPTSAQETSFWQYMFAHAAAQKDVPLFEELLGVVKERKADDKRLQRYLGQLEQQLDALKKAVDGGK